MSNETRQKQNLIYLYKTDGCVFFNQKELIAFFKK
jgi:hypothetical protein